MANEPQACLAPTARHSILSLGQPPQDPENEKKISAEGATHLTRAFSAWLLVSFEFLGVAPGLREKSADGAKTAMAAISKNARVCETCGSPIETTSAGDLGCMVCLLDAGLDAEAEQSDTRICFGAGSLGCLHDRASCGRQLHGSSVTARWESRIARSIKRSTARSR